MTKLDLDALERQCIIQMDMPAHCEAILRLVALVRQADRLAEEMSTHGDCPGCGKNQSPDFDAGHWPDCELGEYRSLRGEGAE
ncbi:MAG: hypothetical protein ACYDAY_11545 [Candidatus Dormibacteria bacterium]